MSGAVLGSPSGRAKALRAPGHILTQKVERIDADTLHEVGLPPEPEEGHF